MTFQRIGVVGCGLMGSGIAEVTARAGCDVLVAEADPRALTAGSERIERSLAQAVKRGKLDESEAGAVQGRLRFVTDLGEFADRDLVVEAVSEAEDVKLAVFRALDAAVESDDAVLASNTSSIPIMKLAMATRRPDQVVGLHFFNPVPVLALVEVVPSLLTSDETADAVDAFAHEALGKNVIRSQDRAGFIVNALLIPYILSAIRMLESGFASAEDIDMGMVQGCAHPMGPLALADLIGLDTGWPSPCRSTRSSRSPSTRHPRSSCAWSTPACSARKSGRGFATYERTDLDLRSAGSVPGGPRRRGAAVGGVVAGQAERALGDDVALDLVGAAVDRRRRREHEGLGEAAALGRRRAPASSAVRRRGCRRRARPTAS